MADTNSIYKVASHHIKEFLPASIAELKMLKGIISLRVMLYGLDLDFGQH